MLPVTSSVLNLYLFGQTGTPSDLLQNTWANRSNEVGETVDLDTAQFMTTGAGRFATGAQSALVQAFFNSGNTLAEGIYSKAQLAGILGLSSYGINFQAYEYADATNDWAERTFVFGSQAFKLDDDVVFRVAADGTRTIENYRIVPNEAVQENFDFVSSNPLTILGNIYLESVIDPSTIGRTVNINFTGPGQAATTYTESDYLADLGNVAAWQANSPSILDLPSAMTSLATEAFQDGITAFLYNDKPVVYGSAEDDILTVPDNPFWYSYYQNGVVMIGGDGDDVITGTSADDLFIGGEGADIYNGAGGYDTVSYIASASVNINLDDMSQNTGDAEGDVYNGISLIVGSKFADSFRGVQGEENHFDGEGGDDTFVFNDRLDTATGGAGADIFKIESYLNSPTIGWFPAFFVHMDDYDFNAPEYFNFSVVKDFNPGEGDKLDFSQFFDLAEARLDVPDGSYQAVIDTLVQFEKLSWQQGNNAVVRFALTSYTDNPEDGYDVWYAGVVLENFDASSLNGGMFLV